MRLSKHKSVHTPNPGARELAIRRIIGNVTMQASYHDINKNNCDLYFRRWQLLRLATGVGRATGFYHRDKISGVRCDSSITGSSYLSVAAAIRA